MYSPVSIPTSTAEPKIFPKALSCRLNVACCCGEVETVKTLAPPLALSSNPFFESQLLGKHLPEDIDHLPTDLTSFCSSPRLNFQLHKRRKETLLQSSVVQGTNVRVRQLWIMNPGAASCKPKSFYAISPSLNLLSCKMGIMRVSKITEIL